MEHILHVPLKPISNAATTTSMFGTVALPQKPIGNRDAAITAATLRRCTNCDRVVDSAEAYRWCGSCRLKQRMKKKKRKENAVIRAATLGGKIADKLVVDAKSVAAGSGSGGKAAMIIHALGGMQLGKRKADEMDDHPDVEVEHASRPPCVQSSPDACEQYQHSLQLCAALSTTLNKYYDACLSSSEPPPYVNFRGTYSVVADAKIPKSKRAELASTELRRVAKLPHSNKTCDQMSSKIWTESFQCDCSRGRARPVPSPAASQTPSASPPELSLNSCKPAPLKRTQSNLSHWILSAGAKPKAAVPVKPGDGAGAAAATSSAAPPDSVRISAEDDNSHPLGIKGLKIVVVVEHCNDMQRDIVKGGRERALRACRV
ncbi:hypothetical protein B0H21DRAFT_760556 [Amylocystis lapponica]|nr:hypothetical protein B0H21DRAFT_760556 [Amylocystis lapponica]